MPLRVGWHLAIQIFQIGIKRESHVKPPGQDLLEGEGWGISLYLVLWRGTFPC
jgi:hypothetical protein